MLVIGILASALLIPASFLVRPAPQAAAPSASGGADAPEVEWTAAQAFRTPQFITLALAHFGCCAAHSGPIFHMVSYAMVCGIAPMTAVTVYSLAGLSGLGGRLALGVMADRIGAKPVLVGGLLVQALCVATYLAVGQLGEFYALSVVFGLAYGGVMPLYAVLVREFFGAESWARCSARFPPLRASAWRSDHGPADGFSIPSTAMAGSLSARSASVWRRSQWRLSFPSPHRPSKPSLELGRAAA